MTIPNLTAMKSFFFCLVIIAICISCRKDEDFSARLISTKYEITSSPKVYTKNGLVTDKTVVENYLKGWAGNYFFLNVDTTVNYPPDTLVYKSRDTLIFPPSGIWGKRVVKPGNGYLFFYMTDTLQGYKRMDNVLNSIVSKIGIVKPFYKESCPWYLGSPCMNEWVYDAYIATGNTNRLEFPLLTYKITRTTSNTGTGLARQNYNNVFDPSVLNLLEDGDTLAIQTAKRIYVRRN